MTDMIDEEITSANLSKSSNPLSGDCASVAQALVNEFGGNFVCLYSSKQNADEELPAHVLVELNGVLYDGSGKLTYQDAFEIHLVLNGSFSADDFCLDYFVNETPPEYMIDPETVENVQELL